MKLLLLFFWLLPMLCYTSSSALSPIGGICTDSKDCAGWDINTPRSECLKGSSSICSCIKGYVSKSDLMDCLPIKHKIDDECEESSQCAQGDLDEFSECSANQAGSTGKCACVSTAVLVPSTPAKCMQAVTLIKEECDYPEQCKKNLGDHTKCEAKCGTTKTCCICDENMSVPRIDGTRCLPIRDKLSAECEQSDQCRNGEVDASKECSNHICTCDMYAVPLPDSDDCVPKVGLGGTCRDNVQCYEATNGLGACEDTECLCTKGVSVPNFENTKCLPIVNKLKGDCEVDAQCESGTPGELSRCLPLNGHRVCQCLPDALEILGEDECFKKADKVEDPCKNAHQCTSKLGGLSECDMNRNVCTCKSGSTASSNNTKCVLTGVLLGQPCEDKNQCFAKDSNCSPSGICSCVPNYIPSQDRRRCLNVVNVIGEICEEIQQCQRGNPGIYSDCIPNDDGNHVCNCTSVAIALPGDNKCRKKGEFVGDICEVQEQCSTSVKNSYCASNKCTCNPTFLPSEDGKNCVEKALLGGQCEDNGQCAETPNASCQEQSIPSLGSICKCNTGFTDANEKAVCYKLADIIGGSCNDHNAQCDNIPDASCLPDADGKKLCKCNLSTHVESPDNKTCLKLVNELDKPCIENAQCKKINNASCQQFGATKTCSCIADFVKSVVQPNTCLQIRHNLNESCTDSIQCFSGFGDNTECRGLVCNCVGGYQAIGRRCYRMVPLGQRCDVNEECHVGHNNLTVCNPIKGCDCSPDAILYSNVCFANRRVGDTCSSDLECRVSIFGESYCDLVTSKCTCLPGDVGDENSDFHTCKSKGDNLVVGSFMILILGNILCKFFM